MKSMSSSDLRSPRLFASPLLGSIMFRYLLALAAAVTLTATPPAAPSNVLLSVGDDQAWTDYGFMVHEHSQTPHLDKLASEGLLFKHGYVPTSLCRASLATMITG